MKSILQTEKKCKICGARSFLDCHHVFGGANRKLSEKYGLKVWLCHDQHHLNGVHKDNSLNLAVKVEAQRQAMLHYGWTKEDWIKIFGKSYL